MEAGRLVHLYACTCVHVADLNRHFSCYICDGFNINKRVRKKHDRDVRLSTGSEWMRMDALDAGKKS